MYDRRKSETRLVNVEKSRMIRGEGRGSSVRQFDMVVG